MPMSAADALLPSLGWAIVGLGRAGQARLRDLGELPGQRIIARVGRVPGPDSVSLADALACADVDAVVIASPNALHYSQAAAALAAGKHVLVDFPLAGTAAEAAALFASAKAAGRILHTELIGQLTDGHRARRADARGADARGADSQNADARGADARGAGARGDDARSADACNRPLTELRLAFSGGFDGWVADEAHAGRVGSLAVGRLHMLWDLAGPLQLVDARLEVDKCGYALAVRLQGHRGAAVHLGEKRTVAGERHLDLSGMYGDGHPLLRPAHQPGQRLFLDDLRHFLRRVASGGKDGAYVDDAVVVSVIDLADAINAATSHTSWSAE